MSAYDSVSVHKPLADPQEGALAFVQMGHHAGQARFCDPAASEAEITARGHQFLILVAEFDAGQHHKAAGAGR
jgi:hypothetical protein